MLESLNIQPSKKLGQNFMIDPNLLAAIVRTAAPQTNELILEVGPGTGVLTAELLSAGARVIAVEYDHRLAEYLRQAYADHPRLQIIEADSCKLDYEKLMPESFRCIANLPYACSSPLLARFSRMKKPPKEIIVLLQQEMAERLCAVPETKAYGALSVRVQLVYDVRILRKVPPEVFCPKPDVGSALTQFKQKLAAPAPELRDFAAKLAQTGFSQRRKKFLTLLKKQYGESAEDALRRVGISLHARAEEVPVSAFVELAACMKAAGGTYLGGQ